MAGEETRFARPGLTYSTYTPVKTELATPNMGQPGAGALWAKVGEMAMQAGDRLQNSPLLNPAVRAQMQESMARAQEGAAMLNYYKNLPPDQQYKRFLLGRETPQGYEMISPAESGAKVFPYFQPKLPTDPNAPPPPPAPSHAPGTGKEPIISEGAKPKESAPSEKKDETEPPKDVSETTPSDLYASNQPGPLPTYGNQNVRFPGGTFQNPGAFLNPATGSYQQLQTQPPSPFGPPGTPSPPPAPMQPPPPPQTNQPTNPLLLANQPQPQNTGSIHPVVSSQDVLQLAKHWNTNVQSVSYHPNGPNGPQFSLFGKNNSPLGQIDATTIAQLNPGLVAGSNTATAMQVAAAGQQAQRPPTGPPVPPAQYPTIAQDQTAPGPSAPPAYNAAPYQQAVTQAMAQPGNLAAEAGPQAGTRTDIAAQPAQPPQPDKEQRTPISDSDKSFFTPEAIANARATAKVDPNAANNNENGDPHVGELGPYHLYRDDTYGTGELYAARPGRSSIYKQQRLVLGSDGWDEYELPTTNMRMNMEAEFAGNKGGVNGAPMQGLGVDVKPDEKFPTFDGKAIANMPVDKMKRWLELAGRYHNTTGEANSPVVQRLINLGSAIQNIQRMADGMDAADKGKISPDMYGLAAQYESHQARKRDELTPPGGWSEFKLNDPSTWPETFRRRAEESLNYDWAAYHDIRARGSQKNTFSNYLEQQSKALNNAIFQLQATGRVPFLVKAQEGTSGSVSGLGLSASFKHGSDEYTSEPSPHLEVQNMFAGDEQPAESRKNLLKLKAGYVKQYIQEYEDATGHNWRPTTEAFRIYRMLKKGESVPDDQNEFKDSGGQTRNPFTTGHKGMPGTPSPSPGQNLPVIKSRAEMDEFKKNSPGKQFQWIDEHGVYHTETAAES